MPNQFAIPKATAASNYSADVDMLTTDLTYAGGISTIGNTGGGGGAGSFRLQLRIGTAAIIKLITKNSAGTVLGSGMLWPKTGSAALGINMMYVFNHMVRADRKYNYQLSIAMANTDLTVDEIQSGHHFE